MIRLSRQAALIKLNVLKRAFSEHVSANYEHRAKACATCETPGACCLDAHFVNVQISRLEADAIRQVIDELPDEKRTIVQQRIDGAIEQFDLAEGGDAFSQKFACPLFEKEVGCLVHGRAKPLACIAHACYERKEDPPPDNLLAEQEARVEDLNIKTYGRSLPWLPIPLAIRRRP